MVGTVEILMVLRYRSFVNAMATGKKERCARLKFKKSTVEPVRLPRLPRQMGPAARISLVARTQTPALTKQKATDFPFAELSAAGLRFLLRLSWLLFRTTTSQPHSTAISATMARARSLLQSVCSLLLLAATSQALKFDLEAFPTHNKYSQRCIRNFVGRDTLVVVTATVDGYRDDGMQVNMHVSANVLTGSLELMDANRRDLVRSWTRQETSMASPGTLWASSAPSSPRTPTPRSMFASRTS